MQIIARTTYTVNNGAEQVKDLTLEVSDNFEANDIGHYTVMSKAADKLTDKGQIMVSSVEILEAA